MVFLCRAPGVGRTAPDPGATATLDGVQVPLGKGSNTNIDDTSLLYNEYPYPNTSTWFTICVRVQRYVLYLVSILFNVIVLAPSFGSMCWVILRVLDYSAGIANPKTAICLRVLERNTWNMQVWRFSLNRRPPSQVHCVRRGAGEPEVPAEDQVQLPDVSLVKGARGQTVQSGCKKTRQRGQHHHGSRTPGVSAFPK